MTIAISNSILRGTAVFCVFAVVGPAIGGVVIWLFGLAIETSDTWNRFLESPWEVLLPIIVPFSYFLGGVPVILTGGFFGVWAAAFVCQILVSRLRLIAPPSSGNETNEVTP